MKEYAAKLEKLLFLDVGGGGTSVSRPEMEAALRDIEQLIDNLQLDMDKLTGNSAARQLLVTLEPSDGLPVVHRAGDQAAGSPFFCKHNPKQQQGEHPERC